MKTTRHELMKRTGTCFSPWITFSYEGCSFNVMNDVVRNYRTRGLVSSPSGSFSVSMLGFLLLSRTTASKKFYFVPVLPVFYTILSCWIWVEDSSVYNQRTGLEICSVKMLYLKSHNMPPNCPTTWDTRHILFCLYPCWEPYSSSWMMWPPLEQIKRIKNKNKIK